MNFRIIAYIVGWICNFQAAFMLLPFFTALIYHEREFSSFLIAMAVCLVIGIPLTLKKPKNKVFYTKDGCVAVALSWVALCVLVRFLLWSVDISHILSMHFLRQFPDSQLPVPAFLQMSRFFRTVF